MMAFSSHQTRLGERTERGGRRDEGGQSLSPRQQFGLMIMSEALGDRSIYFTSRDTASSFGVGDQVVRQGLV